VDLDLKRRRFGERHERGAEASFGQDRRVDTVREVAELAESGLRLTGCLLEQRRSLDVTVGRCGRACQTELVREGKKALLGTVMKVTLEPAALGIACLDDAHPRFAKVVKLREHSRLQALVLEREPNCGTELAFELAYCGGVVHESDSPTVTHKRCDGASGTSNRDLDGTAAGVDIVP